MRAGQQGHDVDLDEAPSHEQREIALERLQPGAHQPRRHFDEDALAELASSIAAQGVVQPIVVRPLGAERYEIVAGERRWRAAQRAGLTSIPAVVRELDERGAMAVALVENIQRADLNPLEEAVALQRLIDECRLTHEQVAEAVGRSRAGVTNLLRLMELEADVQTLVREARLSLGHAKVLLAVSGSRQSSLAKLVADQQMSVRQTEALVQGGGANHNKSANKAATSPVTAELQSKLQTRIGLPVRVQQDAGGAGRVTIKFKSGTELESLLQRIASS
ncbi:MAG: ParB/RepB/Spo0J family partition protein [Panacagrimonas sp.]|nr:ParB/RepB/Spo0J family partition protein [Panacagrimonas sp.]MCC2658140.1 ParB/RepB/Spo0J family partition protein [Panacagrimonas sp.]